MRPIPEEEILRLWKLLRDGQTWMRLDVLRGFAVGLRSCEKLNPLGWRNINSVIDWGLSQ